MEEYHTPRCTGMGSKVDCELLRLLGDPKAALADHEHDQFGQAFDDPALTASATASLVLPVENYAATFREQFG